MRGVDGWQQDGPGGYVIAVSDPRVAAPAVTRALVAAGADVLSIAESRHSLEDVYLELIGEDVEARADERSARPHPRRSAARRLREYRRNGSIIATMAVLPGHLPHPPADHDLPPARLGAAARSHAARARCTCWSCRRGARRRSPPTRWSASAQQGTLEPVLTTPVRREELLLGKAVAVFVPSLAISYAVYASSLVSVRLRASPRSRRRLHGPELLAQVVFTPLLAGWSIWVGIAISARSSDVRVAQQLGILASLPAVAVTSLAPSSVITPTSPSPSAARASCCWSSTSLGWRVVSALFDRERLITGTR